MKLSYLKFWERERKYSTLVHYLGMNACFSFGLECCLVRKPAYSRRGSDRDKVVMFCSVLAVFGAYECIQSDHLM